MEKAYIALIGRKFTCSQEDHDTTYTIEPVIDGKAQVSWTNGTETCPYKINEALAYLQNGGWTLLDK